MANTTTEQAQNLFRTGYVAGSGDKLWLRNLAELGVGSSVQFANLIISGTITGNISGNAATATKFATPVNINGVPFDGSGNITIGATASAGSLTGATLAANVLSSSLTSLGTLANLSVTNTVTGSISGNAATATKLANPVNINGTPFDGSGNITITAVSAAGSLTGTSLAANVISSSLSEVGTITTGTWQGSAIAPAYLGSGSSITGKFLRGDGTWQTIGGGGDALTSGTLAQFASTTSAQLKGVVSDETGSGSLVFANSPALVTPDIGTPSAGNLANCTFPTLNQSTTGNSATATALANSRNINGTPFDGTGNITITAAGSTLTGTSLASGVISSSLTSVGTLANLTVTAPITGSVTGNASTVTTNANLTGDITSSGNSTSIAAGVIINSDINAAAAIAVSKLALPGGATTYLNADGFWTIPAGGGGGGGGTVTSASVVSANGFSGSVTTATTTPAITISTSVTGLLKGNGTAASAAVAGTDYVTPSGSITGNSATATALAAPVNINGVSFNGTSNITVTAAGSTLTGTSLNAAIVTSSLAQVGTITTGTWQGSIIGPAYLGAGSSIAGKFLRGDGTWQGIGGGGDALTTGTLAQFAATSSSQLAGVISDETGSGSLVFGTSPTLITPILGTPASGDLTNCTFPTLNQSTTGNAATVTTNANLTGHITSIGNTTTIPAGTIVNSQINASAAIATSKLALPGGTSVYMDGTGAFSTPPSGTGTVTSASIVSANGFAGSVANASTTPAITISTSITGLVKGNGTSLSEATAGTDYVVPSGSIGGNAATVTTNANLTGDVTSVGNATTIAAGVIVNSDINAAAGIALSKLGQSGATTGQVPKWSGTAWVPGNVGTITSIITGLGASAIQVNNIVALSQADYTAIVTKDANTLYHIIP